jgi:branched-chain amino acid transport system substrate-binding protein
MTWSKHASGALALALSAGLIAAGCGSDDSSSSKSSSSSGSGSKGGTVKVGMVLDMTGPVGFAGVEAKKGIDLAVKQANDSDALGDGTKISVNIQDAASDPKQAASLTQKVARDDSVPVIMVGPGSAGSLAAVPITQKAKLPTDVLESGSPGIVETGDLIYRSSTPQDKFTGLMAEHFKNKGVKTVIQVYNNDIPTNASLAKDVWPGLAKQNGFTITSSEAVPVTATNFGTIASKIASEKPDAVMLHLSGAQYVSFISAVKRAGYTGIIGGGQGASSGTLTPLGKLADGVVYVAEFSSSSDLPVAQKFNDAIKASTGKDATLYASSGYDSMNFIIDALKQAKGDYSREGVAKGMAAAAAAGNPDATTGPVTFENRDARIKGSLVEWKDGKDTIIQP